MPARNRRIAPGATHLDPTTRGQKLLLKALAVPLSALGWLLLSHGYSVTYRAPA